MHSSGFFLDDQIRSEILLGQLQAGAPEGWMPHRIIFRNFWFFHREEFLWHHGRLFLGGQNAAGKSTVLSMAVPLLLDGNKSEDRLNTFGGQGRNMAYYVTGSPSQGDTAEAAYFHQVRTSYMVLEFRRGSQYLTVGQGLHHDRAAEDKSVRSWGFAITDGRRIGRDGFDLIKENRASLTKPELKKLLGEGGEVFDTNLEYKRAVNRHLFGFRDLRDFDALIDLLLQIRRPKLTKEVRPRDVAAILTQSLPTLDDAVMKVTADSLDHIDQTIQNIERIDVQIQAAADVERVTQTVFRRMAEVAAARYSHAAREADAADARLAERQAELTAARERLAQAAGTLATCQQRLSELEAEQRSLEDADVFRAGQQLSDLQAEIGQKEAKLSDLRTAIRLQQQTLKRLAADREAKEDLWHEAYQGTLTEVNIAATEAEAARWESAREWVEMLQRSLENLRPDQPHPDLHTQVPRAAAGEEAKARLQALAAVDGALSRRDAAHQLWQKAQGAEQQAYQRFLEAGAEVSRVASQVEDTRRSAAAAVLEWQAAARFLHLPSELVDTVADALIRYAHQPGGMPQEALRTM